MSGPDPAPVGAVRRVLGRAVIGLTLLATPACSSPYGVAPPPTKDARARVADGARLLDVRTPEEFADSHIEGAINIPVSELGERLAELGPKNGPVVVYCQRGNRSAKAMALLTAAGFESVFDLGPMSAW